MRPERLFTVIVLFVGVGAFIVLVQSNLNKSQAKVVIVVCLLSIMALLWGGSVYFDRKRRRELAAALTIRGLSIGSPMEARFIHRLERGQRSLSGKFWASGMDVHGELAVSEFTYLTGSGKHTATHRNMQVSRQCPGRWPDIHLSRRKSFLSRPISKLTSTQDFGLENEEFTKRWTIECNDRDFVLLLLSPMIQDWLMQAPKEERWTIAEGRVCVTRKRRCRADDVEDMIARLDEFLAMVPEELAAYERLIA